MKTGEWRRKVEARHSELEGGKIIGAIGYEADILSDWEASDRAWVAFTQGMEFGIISRVLHEVNRRAEASMLRGEPITGAHHRAIEAVLEENTKKAIERDLELRKEDPIVGVDRDESRTPGRDKEP